MLTVYLLRGVGFAKPRGVLPRKILTIAEVAFSPADATLRLKLVVDKTRKVPTGKTKLLIIREKLSPGMDQTGTSFS